MVDAHTVRLRRKSPFLEWCDTEQIPIVSGYGVEDLRSVPLLYWERLGAPAAYCHLEGGQGFVGAFVVEIPPGKSLNPISHMYEEQILILEGRGATQFHNNRASNQNITLEWQAGSLFSPPLNVKHQHFNGSGSLLCASSRSTMPRLYLILFGLLSLFLTTLLILLIVFRGRRIFSALN